MTRNGVQMLAAVNGRGAYDANGPKKQRRKARRKTAKARSYSTKARRKGISATKRATYRRKATKATRKAKKRREKAEYQKYVKRMARKAGLGRKELIRLLRGEGLSTSAATKVAACTVGSGGACSTGEGGTNITSAQAAVAAKIVKKAAKKRRKPDYSYLPNGSDAEIYFDNGKVKTMAGRKRKRKAGRKAARRGTRKVARRGKSRRSRSSSRRRTSSKRRSTKRSSRKAGRRSTARGRGRRGMRRNGSDDFEMNGLEYEANGDDFEMNGRYSYNGSDDFEMNGDDFESNAKKRKKSRKAPSKASKFNTKLLKETGLLKTFGPEPVAGMMLDSLAARFEQGQISSDQYKAMRKQIAKAYFPKQEGRGGKVGVTITDPITGKSKVVKVPWKGKVRTAFGPFKRRQKGGMYTYEWEKGEKIPEWALAGAYSRRDYDTMLRTAVGPESFAQKAAEIENRILDARIRVQAAEKAELDRKIQKLQNKLASGKVDDPMTPNARSRGRRRGKRRMSAAQKKALIARLQGGKRKAAKRRGRKSSKRRGSSRRRMGAKRRSTGSKRRSSGKRRSTRKGSKRRSSKRRGSSRRRARKGGRRRSPKRRGRRGFRKNFMGSTSWQELGAAGILGVGAALLLAQFVGPHLAPVLSFAGSYSGALGATILGLGGAAVTIALGKRFAPGSEETVEAAALGMVAVGAVGGVGVALGKLTSGLSGIPYVNTSGWGRRSVGAYELRGAGAYELRGLGAYPQQALAGGQYAQAMAAYELRGMGAYPQQALAGGQYAQAMAAYELRGLGQQPMDQEILPMHADSALDWADQQAGGEYVNSQLQPTAPLFFQDPLADLGVPSSSGGGIPMTSIWNPTGEGFVDPTATVGGNFDDPNV